MMNTNRILLLSAFIATMLWACNILPKETTTEIKDSTAKNNLKSDTTKYAFAMVDNVKDPTCGMPISAGIEDTAHYNNKAIGFCSKECKDEFSKDIAKNSKGVEWKK
jgi:YHS domain-containing protein